VTLASPGTTLLGKPYRFLSLKFPYNLIVYLSLPILVPSALGFVYFRILKQGRESRKRVDEMEKDDSYSSKLIHSVAELERRMEDRVTDFIDDQTGPLAQETPSREKEEDKWWIPCSKKRDGEHLFFCSCRKKNGEHLSPEGAAGGSNKTLDGTGSRSFSSFFKHSSRAPSPEPTSETSSIAGAGSKGEGRCKSKWRSHKKSHAKMDTPVLLDVQREMIERLNKLSGLKKERAFYDDTRNSHASIVCREDRGFTPHVVDSTLRYWADQFVFHY